MKYYKSKNGLSIHCKNFTMLLLLHLILLVMLFFFLDVRYKTKLPCGLLAIHNSL